MSGIRCVFRVIRLQCALTDAVFDVQWDCVAPDGSLGANACFASECHLRNKYSMAVCD